VAHFIPRYFPPRHKEANTPKSFFFTLLKKEQALGEEEEGGAEKKSWCVRDLKRVAHPLHTHRVAKGQK
jgi:hypothetical protein